MTEPWELPDEEIWGAVDATWLFEQFRCADIAVDRAVPGSDAQMWLFWSSFSESLQLASQQMAVALAEFTEAVARITISGHSAERPSRRERALMLTSQPRTLHLAIQVNPRLRRQILDRRPARTPATRRR